MAADGSDYSYLLRSILIRTLVFLLALARCARVMPEPYQFRNAWPRRFERGNIRHQQPTFSLFLRFSRLNRSFSLDRLARGRGGRARSILGLAREGFMACWWASNAPSRSELCPPAGLTCPGRAQPSPPLTPAFARPCPMRQQPPQPTPRHARRPAAERFGGSVHRRIPRLTTYPRR